MKLFIINKEHFSESYVLANSANEAIDKHIDAVKNAAVEEMEENPFLDILTLKFVNKRIVGV